MGRKVTTLGPAEKTPVYISGNTDFNCGTSFTVTETLIDISGSGIVDLLALYNTKDVGVGAYSTLIVYVDVDGTRVESLSASMTSGSYNIIGCFDEWASNHGYQPIPFKSSFKMYLKSSGQENSLSMRGVISYRLV